MKKFIQVKLPQSLTVFININHIESVDVKRFPHDPDSGIEVSVFYSKSKHIKCLELSGVSAERFLETFNSYVV